MVNSLLKPFVDKLNRFQVAVLLLIILLSFVVRFGYLGYSDFYGDETKTFYLDKTIPASQFFLDQRKGPIQFMVVWFTEKFVGTHDELYTRLPFAAAGFLSVLVFYLLIRRLFDPGVGLAATALYSFNGFNIAFSRTVQYQSFLLLFGLLMMYFYILWRESRFGNQSKIKNGFNNYISYILENWLLIGSGTFGGLAFLSHYDAVFFAVPLIYLILKDIKSKKVFIKDLMLIGFPFFVLVGSFYIPYLMSGEFSSNALNYVQRRMTGKEYSQNYSLYTFFAYNPSVLWVGLLISGLAVSFFQKRALWFYVLWVAAPFIFLEIIILNPGTHINNYIIPLFVLVSVVLFKKNFVDPKSLDTILKLITGLIVIFCIMLNIYIFLPVFNKNYPFKDQSIGPSVLEKIDKQYHLYLYGFPYNRGWREIKDYMYSVDGVRGIYTNDNDTIAEYYLAKYDYTRPGPNFLPQYYIEIYDNQEFVEIPEVLFEQLGGGLSSRYEKVKEIYASNKLTASIYKLRN